MTRKTISRRRFVALAAAGAGSVVLAGSAQAETEARVWKTVRQISASGAIGRIRNASILLHDVHTSIDVRAQEAVEVVRKALNLPEPDSFGLAHNPVNGWFSMSCRFSEGVTFAVASVSDAAETSYTIRGELGSIHVAGDKVSVDANGRWIER